MFSMLLRVEIKMLLIMTVLCGSLAVGYDVDEDDKIGLSWTSYSGERS